MIGSEPQEFYSKRKQTLAAAINETSKRYNRIGILRLAIVLAAAIAAYFTWGNWAVVILTIIAGLALFLALVSVSQKLRQQRINLENLASINSEEIKILNGNYAYRPDGLKWEPPHHPYSRDLDIVGHASIFQYIHRTTAEQSDQLLAKWLLQPANEKTILQRQAAAKELSTQPEWRQQLQAHGLTNPLNIPIQDSLAHWLSQPHHFTNTTWKLVRFILPAVSISMLLLYIFDFIQPGIFWLMVLVFFAASGYVSKLVTPQYLQLSKYITQLETLAQSLQWIETANFSTGQLQQIKSMLDSQTLPASKQVRELKKILDRMDYRLNPLVFVPLNTLLFWDLQQIIQLENWKSQHEDKINDWFSAIAQMEALSSLANLAFNHPSWVFPVIRPHWFKLTCHEAGHPLISPAKSVTNNFAMEGHPQLAFITGSNMAGKSTFLRTIGTNLVLAMAGAPVCASQFETPVLKVMTSMRIADNLEESASTFYAELQKLKSIIEAVKRNSADQEPIRVFLLLDEILRGTNSLDRHTGSEALIRQLIKENAVGIIASHDLGLAQLQEEYPGTIHNYHFDVTIIGNELSFDYKLKQGVCQTLNATLLMKKIGIDL
jgi:hypothetical protein